MVRIGAELPKLSRK